jgi:RNA polymerase sigma-70 factor (ECF subfamily)
VISGPFCGRYNQRCVKFSAGFAASRRTTDGREPPGFSDCFRAFDDEFEFVCRALRRAGVPPADVEDLAQDVLIVVWRRWGDFDQGRPLRPWLAGIAARVAHDHLKRRWREIPSDNLESADPALVGEDHVDSSRRRRLILETLAQLPNRHRLLIVLHDLEGLTPQDIARSLGIPLATAYTRLRRARLAFAGAFAAVRRGPADTRSPLAPGERFHRHRAWLTGFAALALATAALAVIPFQKGGRHAPEARAAANTASPSTMGLVGYWPLDDAPGSVIARDRSGHGNDCLLHDGDPARAWAAGSIGGALDLRAGGWLECPQPPLPAGRAPPSMTVMARVLRAEISDAHSAVVTREMGPALDDLFFFGFLGDRLKISSRAWQGWVSRPGSSKPGRWCHIAFTRQTGGSTRLYLDGVQVGENRQGERPVRDGQTPLLVGGGHAGSDGAVIRQHFTGLIDELAVYDRALGPEEIAAAASTSSPLAI